MKEKQYLDMLVESTTHQQAQDHIDDFLSESEVDAFLEGWTKQRTVDLTPGKEKEEIIC